MTTFLQESVPHLRMVDGEFVVGNPELDASWQRAQEQCVALTGSGLDEWENLGYPKEHVIEAFDQLRHTIGEAVTSFYEGTDLTDAQRAESLRTTSRMRPVVNALFETANERIQEEAGHSSVVDTKPSVKELQQVHVMHDLYIAAQPRVAKAMVKAEHIQARADTGTLSSEDRRDYSEEVRVLSVALGKSPDEMPKLPPIQPPMNRDTQTPVVQPRDRIHFNPTKTVATAVAVATLTGIGATGAAAAENSSTGRSSAREAAVVQTVDPSIARVKKELFPDVQQVPGGTTAASQTETVSITLGDNTVQVETMPYDATTPPEVVTMPYDTTSTPETVPLPHETDTNTTPGSQATLAPAEMVTPEPTNPDVTVTPPTDEATPSTTASAPATTEQLTPEGTAEPSAQASTALSSADTVPPEATEAQASVAVTPDETPAQQDIHPRTRRDNDRRAKEVEATLKPDLVTLLGNLSTAAETGDPRKVIPSLSAEQAADPAVQKVVEALAAVTKGLIAGDPDAIALSKGLALDRVTEDLAANASLTAEGVDTELPPDVGRGVAHAVMTLSDIAIARDQESSTPETQPAAPSTPETPAEQETLPAGVLSSERTPEGHAQLTTEALLPEWDITLKSIDGALKSNNLRDVGLPDSAENGLKPVPITDSMREKIETYQKLFDKILVGDADAIAQFDDARIKDYKEMLEQELKDTESPVHIVKMGDGYVELSKDQTKAFLATYIELVGYIAKETPQDEPQVETPPAEEAPGEEREGEDPNRGNDREYEGNTTDSGIPVPESLQSDGFNVRYFSQWDKRWANKQYSSVDNPEQTIGSSGCAPTSMAMVASSLTGKDVLPSEVADYNLENGYRSPEDGTKHEAFQPYAESKGITVEPLETEIDAIIAFFEKHKKAGKQGYIIASGKDKIPKTPFTTAGHFIVIYGVSDDGDLLVADPNSLSKSSEPHDSGWSPESVLPYVGRFFKGFSI